MFKKLAAIAATTVCCLGNLPEAQARGWDYCMDAGPTNICAIYESQNDVVQMQGPAGYQPNVGGTQNRFTPAFQIPFPEGVRDSRHRYSSLGNRHEMNEYLQTTS